MRPEGGATGDLVGAGQLSFSSARLSAQRLKELCQASPCAEDVTQMDEALAGSLWGQDHFVDLSDHDSAQDFVQRSIGYYLADHGSVIGAAFGSLVCSRGIEVSISVAPDYRRRGVATAVGSRLVLWCLEKDMDAHWDAANPPSCRLAEKLGCTRTGAYRAYLLKE